jgi:hypothetical protein
MATDGIRRVTSTRGRFTEVMTSRRRHDAIDDRMIDESVEPTDHPIVVHPIIDSPDLNARTTCSIHSDCRPRTVR